MWNFFFWKIVKIAFRNESCKLFFQEDAKIAPKTRLSITFSWQIQMEWIKALHVDKNIIYKKKIFSKNNSKFCKFFWYLVSLVLSLFGHNFCSQAPIGKKKLYSYEAIQFFYLKKKTQKLKTKIVTVGTYLKSHLSLKGTMGL